MLKSIQQIYGNKLGAKDGEIGHVKDFYFDDGDWTVRYLVADTGSWLSGRKVLISPYCLGRLDQAEKILRVNLTKAQIAASPAIDAHKPVSRQYEEEYHKYYGWPYYWQGDALWGMSGLPVLDTPVEYPPGHQPARPDTDEPHLRSAQAVNGYNIQASDGTIGHVCDFMVDSENWQIGRLVIRTGHRLSGKEVLVSMKDVGEISYEDSTVTVRLTKAAVEQSPAYPPALEEAKA